MTPHPQSEVVEEGLNRRALVQAFGASAVAAGFASPSSAQQVSVGATSTNYVRDPTRWGSAEVAALFPGFKHIDMRTKGAARRDSAPQAVRRRRTM